MSRDLGGQKIKILTHAPQLESELLEVQKFFKRTFVKYIFSSLTGVCAMQGRLAWQTQAGGTPT